MAFKEKSFASPCKDDFISSWKCLAMLGGMPSLIQFVSWLIRI